MQTYYQKHRKIRAFQYDGTLSQLKRELPEDIFNEVLNGLEYYIQFLHSIDKLSRSDYRDEYQLLQNDQHQYSMYVYTSNWPVKHYKSPKRYQSKGKYATLLVKLQPGDYIRITQPSNSIKVTSGKLKFYRQADFEAHWSKDPIRK